MDHARGEVVSANGSDLDPDIRRFIRTIAEPERATSAFRQRSLSAERRWAEEARAPWRRAGRRCSRRGNLRCRRGTARCARAFTARSSGILPGLVYLHGGGWTLFSIDTHDRVMREYASRAGCCVIGVDYALSPEQKFPVPLEQIVDVVDWLAEQGRALGIDADRLAIGGDSAGANLSVATCLLRRDQASIPPLRAMLLNYGAFVLALFRGRLPALWRPGIHARLRGNDPVLAQLHAQRRGRSRIRSSARCWPRSMACRPHSSRSPNATCSPSRTSRWRAG